MRVDKNILRFSKTELKHIHPSTYLVSNKRQNGLTNRAQILCGTSHDPRKGLWNIKIEKKMINIWNFFGKKNPPKFENYFKWPTFRETLLS